MPNAVERRTHALELIPTKESASRIRRKPSEHGVSLANLIPVRLDENFPKFLVFISKQERCDDDVALCLGSGSLT